MGWAVGFDPNWRRDVGYGVPAVCDHPRCNAEIDRGLAYVCGGEPFGGEEGCGLFFCSDHMRFGKERQVCIRCVHHKPAYTPKPDVREWLEHKLTDPTWEEWRQSEPDEVARVREALGAPKDEVRPVLANIDAPEAEPSGADAEG